jgi:hypothetical protein
MTKNKFIKAAKEFNGNDKLLTSDFLKMAYDEYFHSSNYYLANQEVNELTRYSSWNICYQYFRDEFFKKDEIKDEDPDLRIAGLHLAFYLASWGMFRNPMLLNSGIKKYELLAKELFILKGCKESKNQQFEKIKFFLKNWKENPVEKVAESSGTIANNQINPTDTLITKIMLGAYSNTPAFDRFFKTTVSRFYIENNGRLVGKLEEKIQKIFSIKVEGDIKAVGDFIKSLSKNSAKEFSLEDIKILDAIFFQIGWALDYEAEEE